MVIVPAGRFTMGTAASEPGHAANESPEHPVTIPRAFAVGAYPVTRDEYGQFVRTTGRTNTGGCRSVGKQGWVVDAKGSWENPGFTQDGKHAVVCVSFNDATDYVRWLSQRTGHAYRLLTEAEREYVARAGTQTPYYWGTAESHEHANYGTTQCCDAHREGRDQWDYTSPVGAFPPNAFGVYDTSGNVFEWAQDCWHADFNGAPADGSAWLDAGCNDHLHRGSSWHASAAFLRIGYRIHDPADVRNIYLGFRIARDLEAAEQPAAGSATH